MSNLRPKIEPKTITGVLAVLFVLAIIVGILSFAGQFFYFLERVDTQEVGVRFSGGRIKDVVGPGVYSDFGLYVQLVRISTQALPFDVQDAEIITKDKQRIGVVVSGDIFRPSEAERDILHAKWAQYRNLFTSDGDAQKRIGDFARQAMKVCVGSRTFDDSTIGSARDDLRACIDTELDKLATEVGLTVRNVVVPEVILSEAVQASLDAIVQSRLETEKAAQDELKAKAQAEAERARVEGEIRVEQSRLQETTRQQIVLAELEQQRVSAQLKVIEAERANKLAQLETEYQEIESRKANELLSAQRDRDIRTAEAEALVLKARGDVAFQVALAELYVKYPEYRAITIAQANASALRETDKIIFTVEGSAPTVVLPGPGIMPVANVTP